MSLEEIEFAINREPRCPVVLLLDTSTSMSGERIAQLNMGIKTFKQDVEQDTTASLRIEIAIVTFDSSVRIVQDFVTIDQFTPPELVAEGTTQMGQAIELALDKVEKRKLIYNKYGNSYYQPWIFLITDGEPNDEYQKAANRVKLAVENRKLNFFAVGVKGANMDKLRQIAPPNIPPVMLDRLKFQELFLWLSATMKKVSSSEVGSGQVESPPITWTVNL